MALEGYPGVDDVVGDIGGKVQEQAEKGEEVKRAEHHRVVPAERRLVAEETDPVEALDFLWSNKIFASQPNL